VVPSGYFTDTPSSISLFLWNRISDSVYEGENEHFGASDIVPASSGEHAEISRSIERMVGLQQVLAAHFSQKDALRNHIFRSAHEGE
jgi:hypothetical protein